MKIGVMGGTFDPIHIGHLLLGEFAYEAFDLDEVWYLPNGNPPHKEAEITKEALKHRIKMVELATESVPYFKVSLHEAEIGVHSYTYQTMGTFCEMYPDAEFYFILGADSLFSIEQWKYFKEIFPTCTILAAMRDDKDIEDMKHQIAYLRDTYGARIELLRAPLLEISSTKIRERAAKGLTVHYMVPDAVADYIVKQSLYKTDKDEDSHDRYS